MDFESVLRYKTAMSVFMKWYADALISDEELLTIDTMIAEKYRLPLYSIYRTNNLLCRRTRANMDEDT